MSSEGRYGDVVARIEELKAAHPQNLALQAFDREYFFSLADDELRDRLLRIMNSAIEVPKSEVGCYAMQASDHVDFAPFLHRVLEGYHHVDLTREVHPREGWDIEAVLAEDLTVGEEMSIRIRVGRNLPSLNLPASMSVQERLILEEKMVTVFEKFIADPTMGGRYISLTAGHKNEITEEEYGAVVRRHLMFKRMDKDPFLLTAGIASDWPSGRGAYISEDEGFVVWVGEEDHLRIMCMDKHCNDIRKVYRRLHSCYSTISEGIGEAFACNDTVGFVACCPSNCGTCMRASVHLRLPHLTKDEAALKELCKGMGLSVRGEHGEHSAFGEGGLADISPKRRMMITEADIVRTLHRGVQTLQRLEKEKANASL